MATKSKIRLDSNFKAAKKAGDEAVSFAILAGTNEMRDKTKERIDAGASRRGYNMDSSSVQAKVFPMYGRVSLDEFWWRFFEYGTIHLAAMPFLRPGHRAGKKVVLAVLGRDFEKWVRRRARVR